MTDNTNPLMRYKLSDEMLTWPMIAKSTGISVQTLISLASKNREQVGNVTLTTAAKLKNTIGVDLSEYLITNK